MTAIVSIEQEKYINHIKTNYTSSTNLKYYYPFYEIHIKLVDINFYVKLCERLMISRIWGMHMDFYPKNINDSFTLFSKTMI